MDYNFIIIVSVGAGLILLVIFLIFSHLNKTSRPSYTDAVASPHAEENTYRGALRDDTALKGNINSTVTGAGSTVTSIWNETLPECDIRDDTFISNVFLQSIPGVGDVVVRTNLGKFEFK